MYFSFCYWEILKYVIFTSGLCFLLRNCKIRHILITFFILRKLKPIHITICFFFFIENFQNQVYFLSYLLRNCKNQNIFTAFFFIEELYDHSFFYVFFFVIRMVIQFHQIYSFLLRKIVQVFICLFLFHWEIVRFDIIFYWGIVKSVIQQPFFFNLYSDTVLLL